MIKYEKQKAIHNKETNRLDLKKTVINRVDSIKLSENQEEEEEVKKISLKDIKNKTNFNTIPIQVTVPIQTTPIINQIPSVETLQKPSRTIKKSNILLNNDENIVLSTKENQEKISKTLININSEVEVEVEGTIASNSEMIKKSSSHYFNIDFLNINNNQSIINNTDSDSVSNISNNDNDNEDNNNDDLFYIPITQRQNNKLNTNTNTTNNNKSNILNKEIKELIINEIKEINNKEKVIYDNDNRQPNYFDYDLSEEVTDLVEYNDKDNECIDDFINWFNREENRRNRLKEKNDKHIKDSDLLKKRRNMTDNQILKENYLLGADSTIESFQRKYSYLQKYYAKPAYYQQEQMKEGHVLNRDFNIRTEDEMVNIEALPKVLQKRRGAFGKKGQSKYTHLGDVDTTEFNKDYKIKVDLGRKRNGLK